MFTTLIVAMAGAAGAQDARSAPAPVPGVASPQTSPGATLIDRTRVDRAAPTLPPPPATSGDPAAAIAADAPDVRIAGIRFTGTDAPAPVARAGERFLGRPASRQVLGELAAALSQAYAGADVALYTVAIPQQDFARGVVVVRLVEGRIAGVDFARPAGPQLRGRLAPLTQERPLSRATFERQLTLARAIPGLTVGTDLLDPGGTGALVLRATPVQQRRKLTAGYSSRGVDLLGAGQLDLGAALYGLVRDGDQFSVAAAASPDLRRYRLATAGYASPVGSSGLTAGLSGAYLETRPRGRTGKGTAKQLAASLSYPWARSFSSAGDVTLSLDGLNNDDATIAGVIVSEHSRALRLAAGYARANPRRSWSLSGTVSRGLDLAGARAAGSDIAFTKLSASVALAQAIGTRLTARLNASGQYSADRLPAAERFAIGGAAIGRAFDESLLSGDRGGGGAAELGWRPLTAGRFAQSELYAFADHGRVRLASRAGFAARAFRLSSAGVGARARYAAKGEVGVEAARVLERPFAGYRSDWAFIASWRLTL